MTEKEILKKIDKWSDENLIKSIVNFIENLPAEKKTTSVLSELGRAYNNLYWEDSISENEIYLKKAIDVFKYLEDELGETEKWNYRIGYSYFYLNMLKEARHHLEKAQNLDGAKELLEFIDIAEEKNLPVLSVIEGGVGGVEFILNEFMEVVKTKSLEMYNLLDSPASEESIEQLELRLGFNLPDDFKQLHRTFSGQKEKSNFMILSNGQRFIGLDEIEEIQENWKSSIKEKITPDVDNAQLPDDVFLHQGEIKNKLFNKKWIPLLISQSNNYLCIDLDNDTQGEYGQLISVSIGNKIDECFISTVFYDIRIWLHNILESIKNDRLYYNDEKKCFVLKEKTFDFKYSREEQYALEKYINENFGEIAYVVNNNNIPSINCDIYVIEPSTDRNYYTLISSGMGAYSMNIPYEYDGEPNIEIAINLPPTWNMNSNDEKDLWPFKIIDIIYQLPFMENTFLSWGHTIPVGDMMEGTDFNCILMIYARDRKKDDDAIAQLPSGKNVLFYYLVPIYSEETNYKLNNGSSELLELFVENDFDFPPVVDLNRKNVCEGFTPQEDKNILNGIKWAFSSKQYINIMSFWDDLKDYNYDINNTYIDNFNPFKLFCNKNKIKVIYKVQNIVSDDLYSFEKLLNEENFSKNDKDEYENVYVMAELETDDEITAIKALWMIQNTLANKILGEKIFFESLEFEGYSEDETPIFFINCT